MIVFVIVTIFFWSFLLFSALSDEKMLTPKSLFIWFGANLIIGWGLYWLLAKFLHIKIVMLITGLIILVSGFRWLGILAKDFFSFFENLTFMNFGRISGSYAVYFAGLAATAQLTAMGVDLNGFMWIFIENMLLAGFLPILLSLKKKLTDHEWIKPLIFIETGIYLTVMGLVIMGGDVPYFILDIEKILHI